MKTKKKAVVKFLRVKTTDYYGRWQVLGDLEKGDFIRVVWPDGSRTFHYLVERLGSDTMQIDMNGGPDRFKTRELFIETQLRGMRLMMPLKGLRVVLVSRKRDVAKGKRKAR